MMHPFANVGGLFDEDLESWQGQFGCSIESFEFYETDETRGLRARREVGPRADVRADQRRAAEPRRRRRSGARTTTSTSGAPRAAARTGACSARTSPTRRTGSRCPRRSPTPRASRRRRSTTGSRDNSRRLLDFHIEKASAVAARGRRPHGRGRSADALLGLAPARARRAWATTARRRSSTAGTGPTTCPTCTSSTAVLRHVGRRQSHVARSARWRSAPPTTWSRPASSSRCRCERRPTAGEDRRDARPGRGRPSPPSPAT